MGRKKFYYLKIPILLVGILFLFTSCTITTHNLGSGSLQPGVHKVKKGPPPWAPAYGHRAKHKYRYYQDSEVYFDNDRGLYFYYSGGSWRTSVKIPTGMRINLNNFVTLEMDSDRPYKHHYEVKKKHPKKHHKKKKKKRD